MKRSLLFCAAIALASLAATVGGATPPASAEPVTKGTVTSPVAGGSGQRASKPGPAANRMHGMHHGKGKHGQGPKHGGKGKHQEFHRQLINRLDLMDARLAKIEAMLEKLLRR